MSARVAIACSGLGHIRRGNETWARTVAEALHAAGQPVTLFGGATQLEVRCPYQPLRNWPRHHPLTQPWLSWHHRYLLEQITFAFALRRHLRQHPFDIVHVGDPNLAQQLQRHARTLGLRVVYKDGLQLGPTWCRQFDFVHVLAPYYYEQASALGLDLRNWAVIPHLVDVHRFAPATDRAALRARWLGPAVTDAVFVVLAVGDYLPGSSKRLDWIVGEMARMRPAKSTCLVLAGQATRRAFQRFDQQARAILGQQLRLFSNLAPAEVAELYRAADVFAHAALHEPFGIVFVEAMASGLPILGHHYEVTRWIIGDGGQVVDMTAPGALSDVLARWQCDHALRDQFRTRARARAVSEFAVERIVPLYQQLYRRVRRA
ncbi:MAG: glycosyltransferase family 4 protein [Verrucomicrobia bacterium]|nr:glycosyltransferase family 4 protein [Verrucomicrobiota bacterium]